jgi:hypothetical protein
MRSNFYPIVIVTLLDDNSCHHLLRLILNDFPLKKPKNWCVCIWFVGGFFQATFLDLNVDGGTCHRPAEPQCQCIFVCCNSLSDFTVVR